MPVENAVLSVRTVVAKGAGGIILFGSDAPSTLPADLAALRRAAGDVPPLVMVDEEGGRSSGWPTWSAICRGPGLWRPP